MFTGMLILMAAMAQPAPRAPISDSPTVTITNNSVACNVGELVEVAERLIYGEAMRGDELAKVRECRAAIEGYREWFQSQYQLTLDDGLIHPLGHAEPTRSRCCDEDCLTMCVGGGE